MTEHEKIAYLCGVTPSMETAYLAAKATERAELTLLSARLGAQAEEARKMAWLMGVSVSHFLGTANARATSACEAAISTRVAVLDAMMPVMSSGEAQLLPAGKFTGRDGRPEQPGYWRLDDAAGFLLALKVNAVASVTPIVIDYDHQTIHAQMNGQTAPAAGWIKSVTWRNGQGLFASVEWTARAKALIDSGEYRYISPVIEYSRADGAVSGLHNAALLNHPALLGMQAVKASGATPVATTW